MHVWQASLTSTILWYLNPKFWNWRRSQAYLPIDLLCGNMWNEKEIGCSEPIPVPKPGNSVLQHHSKTRTNAFADSQSKTLLGSLFQSGTDSLAKTTSNSCLTLLFCSFRLCTMLTHICANPKNCYPLSVWAFTILKVCVKFYLFRLRSSRQKLRFRGHYAWLYPSILDPKHWALTRVHQEHATGPARHCAMVFLGNRSFSLWKGN